MPHCSHCRGKSAGRVRAYSHTREQHKLCFSGRLGTYCRRFGLAVGLAYAALAIFGRRCRVCQLRAALLGEQITRVVDGTNSEQRAGERGNPPRSSRRLLGLTSTSGAFPQTSHASGLSSSSSSGCSSRRSSRFTLSTAAPPAPPSPPPCPFCNIPPRRESSAARTAASPCGHAALSRAIRKTPKQSSRCSGSF